ncbi:Uncharacterised protein [Bordetella pertussis]|nr:Uncharacterised protein [Bordetella pertussis]
MTCGDTLRLIHSVSGRSSQAAHPSSSSTGTRQRCNRPASLWPGSPDLGGGKAVIGSAVMREWDEGRIAATRRPAIVLAKYDTAKTVRG